MKPAYLIAGSDDARIDAARSRLRARAEREGGVAALESFEPVEGRGAPDADALVAAIQAMSLAISRRYLLAEGVERWKAPEAATVAAALGSLPDETTVVLIARGKEPAKLRDAVKAAAGEVLEYNAPSEREMPRRLVEDARSRGFGLAPDAARLLVSRMGANPVRLANELERLALWAGPGGDVTLADLESMIVDTSETAVWALSDALVEGRADGALEAAERLGSQGESVTGIVYGVASRLRQAHRAASELEAGRSPQQVQAGLSMHPYAAKMLVRRARNADPAALRGALIALAELELWCRGESDYEESLALTLALRRAAGAPR